MAKSIIGRHRSREKIVVSLLLILFLIVGIVTGTAANRDPLKVSIQPQAASSETDRQRIIIWIENTSDKMFSGTLFFELLDTNELADFFSFRIEQLLPGQKTYEVTVPKRPDRITEYTYRYRGTFGDAEAAGTALEYQEAGREGGSEYMIFYIYTSYVKRDDIQRIVDFYKGRFTEVSSMKICFYWDRDHTPGSAHEAEGYLRYLTASYSLIRPKDFERLKMLR